MENFDRGCQAAVITGSIAKFFDFPIVLWAAVFSSSLLDSSQYPTMMAPTWSSINQARTLLRLFERYHWKEVAVVYYSARSDVIPRCSLIMDDLETLMNDNPNMTMTYRRQISNFTNATFKNVLQAIKDVSRITVICLESPEARRNLLIAIAEESMDTNEYMWLMVESRRLGFGEAWKDTKAVPDGKDSLALRAAQKFLVIDSEPLNASAQFIDDIEAKMRQPPYNCTDCENIDPALSQVGELADAMLLYALALNRSIAAGVPNPTGSQLVQFSKGEFEGFTGTLIINENATRDPVFLVYGLDSAGQQIVMMRITEKLDNNSIALIEDVQPPSVIWATHGGVPPLNRPICDYDGSACPLSFVEQYLAITLAAVIVPICIIIAAVFFIMSYVQVTLSFLNYFRARTREEERLNRLWQIPFVMLMKPNTKTTIHSSRSLQSTITSSTKVTIDSKKDTLRHSFFLLVDDAVVARKHSGRPILRNNECYMMRKMRSTDHDNLCKFHGISLDGPMVLSVWKYCSRGSLKDVIAKGSLQMDWFFKYSLIRDICEGIYYLHHSNIGAHGWISSGTCLVDERWQVKLTFYGLDALKLTEVREQQDYLWVAPEHIRDHALRPTKEGDLYSFAIVCSEVITKKSAWDLENLDYDLDELLYKIKRGGRLPIRPLLDTEDEHNTSLSLLIKDCWSEEPGERPSIDQVKILIKSLNHNRSSNLMDHVFNVLEQYASNLEDEVQSRMKELTEEKKKSDILLYRMLPKQVAEKLKHGQSVEPETFDCATLFFSDVVSFTTLASRCTPLQVVNLLNDLYTLFDAIIDEHDVYKVETIGDGYLCVSGLPHRNGNEHAKEIAEMSFELLKAISGFQIPHLLKERINIRVGLHTGSVVTGVVGMTMPRYCLFGDAVNTASRMESNGKPGRIHISSDTMEFLTKVVGGDYKTEPRGEVIVKGKGALETHWLLTPEEQQQSYMD
uniref:Guanylate cyclase n=1 Tax=Haemonchus contortus TaxID=6289 RepID=A0A7I5EBS6_HAECO